MCGKDAIRIAETVAQPYSLVAAHVLVGNLHLAKGDVAEALPLLERALLLLETSRGFFFPVVASSLGRAYVRSGRVAEGVSLLERVVASERDTLLRTGFSGQAAVLVHLGEVYLLSGRNGRGAPGCPTRPDHQGEEAAQEYPDVRRDTGIRTAIGIPLLREGIAIGAFSAYRTESRPFSEREVALLRAFADQAVIAIEKVRLFNETKEALDQQTATAEVLRVISKSPTDVQLVLDAIAASAARVCGAADALVIRVEDGASYSVAHFGTLPLSPGVEGRPVTRRFVVGRAILDRRTIHRWRSAWVR